MHYLIIFLNNVQDEDVMVNEWYSSNYFTTPFPSSVTNVDLSDLVHRLPCQKHALNLNLVNFVVQGNVISLDQLFFSRQKAFPTFREMVVYK